MYLWITLFSDASTVWLGHLKKTHIWLVWGKKVHSASRWDRVQIWKRAIMYQSLKRILNNSTCPCSLKDTAVSNALEKHAGWVQTFTFIYMHLADAFFWKATHDKGDIRFSSDVYVTYEAEERSQMEYPEIIHWCFRDTQTTWISLFTSPEKALFSQLVPICFQLLL